MFDFMPLISEGECGEVCASEDENIWKSVP